MTLVRTAFLKSILVCLFTLGLMLIGCAGTSSKTTTLTPPERLERLESGDQEYNINDASSEVLIEVGKAGTQPQLGHVHLLRVHQLAGVLMLNSQRVNRRIYMQFPVAGIEVDNDILRAQAGEKYSKPVREKDKIATYQNMLSEKVLDAEIYPIITMQSIRIKRVEHQYEMDLKIQVMDRVSMVNLPFDLRESEDKVCAQGSFSLNQKELGITPLSVFMGAIKVADELIVHFDVCADSQA